MFRSLKFRFILPALFLFVTTLFAQAPPPQKTAPATKVPAEALKEPNPVKSSPESLARAKRWWNIDCATCHGKEGDGKGETATDMKLTIPDFTNPATLKDKTDGELYYVIKNGHETMPAEGPRVKTEEGWDLVNYVRSLVKNAESEKKP